MILWLYIIEYRVCNVKIDTAGTSVLQWYKQEICQFRYPAEKTSTHWCQPSSTAAMLSLKYPYIFKWSQGTPLARVPLFASTCQQKWSNLLIPYLCLILMLHVGRVKLETKEHQRGWLLGSKEGVTCIQSYISKMQKLPALIPNMLLKKDRKLLDQRVWSRVDWFILLGAYTFLSIYRKKNMNDEG